MTAYTHTLVLCCPLSLAPDLTHLAGCWSENFHLGGYETANKSRDGTDYIVKGTVCTDSLLIRSGQAPERHPDDTEQLTDMDAAQRAYNNLMIVQRPAEGESWPTFPADKVIAFVDVPLSEAIELMGLNEPTESEL